MFTPTFVYDVKNLAVPFAFGGSGSVLTLLLLDGENSISDSSVRYSFCAVSNRTHSGRALQCLFPPMSSTTYERPSALMMARHSRICS